jgi:ABC-type glucose/galactose transport system permease subunit
MNRNELKIKMQEYNHGYKDGLKVSIAQGRYEMGKVQWRKLFLYQFLAVCLALLLWTCLSYADQLPALFLGL